MAGSLKEPPVFNPDVDGGDSYANWKSDVKVWCMLYSDKKKTGPAVYVSLKGEAKDAVRSIDIDRLVEEDGVDLIIAELDKIYKKDESTLGFCAIKDFVEYRRTKEQNFTKFMVEFNNRLRQVKKHGLNFEDGILAYFVLKAANLTEDNERLVRATSKLKLDDVKDKLKEVFGDNDGERNGETMAVKEECFYVRGRGRVGAQRIQRTPQYGNYGKERRRGNPTGSDGKPLKCFECESTMHLSTECPHRRERTRDQYRQSEHAAFTVQLTLVATSEQDGLLADTLSKAVLDCGCTKTVAGATWVSEYISLLSDEQQENVKKSEVKSNTMYRFGDGKETKSLKRVKIPMVMCGQRNDVEVEVVDNDIPLLLGRPTMTLMKMNIDCENHCVNVGGRRYDLEVGPTGHYILPVSELADRNTRVVFHLENLQTYDRKEKEKKAKKLHRQFAHASKERLIKLLKDGGCVDKEFIRIVEEICDKCEFCQKYRHSKPKPVVAFPKANDFNQVVSMDLKEITKGEIWILHMVDSATRYTVAGIIKTKRKEVIVERVLKLWIAYFGAPSKLHSDCGGEFENEVLKELNEQFGTETSTTPGESPWSNGTVERGNAMLFETMMKTKEDVGCNLETALAWAVCAKNSLCNYSGYSPNQLVFGRNVTLPSIMNSDPPALDVPCSEIVRTNLNSLHEARKNYVKAEASERIKRALKHNIRTYSEVDFVQGEKVFYRRRNDRHWRGPGKVLGKEGNFVLIRHGASYHRCHPCRLIKKIPDGTSTTRKETEGNMVSMDVNQTFENNKIEAREACGEQNSSESDDEFYDASEDERVENMPAEDDVANIRNIARPTEDDAVDNTRKKESAALRRLKDHNRPGLDEVFFLIEEEVAKAKETEFNNLKENDVFELVKDEGQKAVSCRWVYQDKLKDGVKSVKARLVARGFEERLADKKVDSPTCSRQGLRLTFTAAATMGWEISTLDISCAFLQGNALERTVYVRPPKELQEEGYIWKLKRCLYGLSDAPREWYDRVCQEMKNMGGTLSIYDKCVFLWHENGNLIGIITTHVDDFQYAGTLKWKENVIGNLMKTFRISKQAEGSFKYIGLQVEQEGSDIFVNQNEYCVNLKEVKVSGSKEEKLNDQEKAELRTICGQALWATSQTRPDVAFESCQISNPGGEPTRKLLVDANKVIRKLRNEGMRVAFPGLGDPERIMVTVYGDGSHASLPSGASQGGNIVFLTGNGRAAPICWKSKKLDRVTKSPLATEVSAAADATDHGYLVAAMVKEIFNCKNLPTINLLTDSKSLKDHLETTKVISDSRLRVDIARLREMQALGEIKVKWVPGQRMLADALTKRGASADLLRQVLVSGVLPEH